MRRRLIFFALAAAGCARCSRREAEGPERFLPAGAPVVRLARDRKGAGYRATSELGGHQIVSYRKDADAPPALSYTIVSDFALLAPEPGGVTMVAEAAGRPRSDSLAASAEYSRARA